MLEQRKCKRVNCNNSFLVSITGRQKGKRYCSLSCQNSEQQLRSKRKKKKEVFKLLGDECVQCGFLDKRALQIDHVNGDGCKDRKSKSNQLDYLRHVLRELKSGSKKYQLLCANCNWIKRVKNKEHT